VLAARIEVAVDGIWAFLAVTLVLSLSPGPDDVLVVRSSLRGGPRLGLATVAGVAAGSLAWGAAATLGLGTVVAGSPPVHDVLRVAGACYLVGLGLAPVLAELSRHRARLVPVRASWADPVCRSSGTIRGAFAAGLLSDLLNPKIGLFYVAVVPQFVPAGAPAWHYALLCAVDVAVAVVWLSALAWLAHAAVTWLRRAPVRVWFQRVSSAALVGIGASVVAGF
jgi:threonine/homoserine/homoserine lactone efflux protein